MELKTAETGKKESFANRLVKAGYSDFLVIQRGDAREILTPKRIEIIEKLEETDVSSIRNLSRELDRDVKQVSEDLDILYQASVIEYRQEGKRKMPLLSHSHIFIEPIV